MKMLLSSLTVSVIAIVVVIPDLFRDLSSRTFSVICHSGACSVICHPGLVPGSLIAHLRDPPDKPGDDKQKSSLILR
jgi:hypothetical protein